MFGSTPHIQHKPSSVIKAGGSLEGVDFHAGLASQIKELLERRTVVVVSGGGREIDSICSRLGIEIRKKDGIRFTDAETLRIAMMSLARNAAELAACLCSAGIDSLPLPAFSAGVSATNMRREHGLVAGEMKVDTDRLRHVISLGVPVIYPITMCGTQLLNVNADELASELAIAIGAKELLLLTDVDGVIVGGRVLERYNAERGDDGVQGGMIPKVDAAIRARRHGVDRVWIANGNREGVVEGIMEGKVNGTEIEG